ncbi:substrate-binding periplasmic protein [Fundidesulfovibrio soli]|uniref:substrate-binding periplasmic protein n=1 Tax=Fundidesulfovibrio soli TaxID=2922716 RepID=UPI001FAF516A|nr:transporter substrate-binding domain-containing protein [Fundidesulfovibrio soli]
MAASRLLDVALGVCVVLLAACGPCLAGQAVVFNTGEWRPYTSEALQGHGFVVELVSAVCAKAGIEPRFDFLPWARAEAGVASGAAFAAFPYARTPARAENYDFTEPLFYGLSAALVREDNAKLRQFLAGGLTLADMKGLACGALIGSVQASLLEGAGVAVKQAPRTEQLLDMLRTGRLDCVVDDQDVLLHSVHIDPQGRDFRLVTVKEFKRRPVGLIVSRRYPGAKALLQRFDEAVRALRASGEYEALAVRFGLEVDP